MEDSRIIELFFSRSEKAISEIGKKYGKYCSYIASRILDSREEEEECVSDTYMRAWDSIPPNRPENLKGYLGKLTRNLAINRAQALSAQKRGSGELPSLLDELSQCVSSGGEDSRITDSLAIRSALNKFLSSLSPEAQRVFTRRYFYMSSVREIANEYGMTENSVGVMLFRAREKLREFLKEEGIEL